MSLRANPRSFWLALLLLSLGWCQADDLEQGFSNPPDLAKPGVWWHWMGCNVTKAGITRDLEAFKRAGIGGATIFGMADVCSPWAAHIENSPTDGLIAFTDAWWQMVRHAAAEGKRLGIDVGLHNCPGYTSTGGPWITPELAMQQIFQSETRVEGGAAFEGILPRPKVDPRGDMLFPMVNKQTGALEKPIIPGRTNYWCDIAVLAVPSQGVIAKDQVIDLTSKTDATGRLEWSPPAGKWVIYRFGHTTMGALTQPNQWETMGLECDKMSEQAVTFHLQHVIGELKKHLGPLVGTGLQHILLDSYEAGKPSWTPLMPQEFAQRRGYDLKAFLPTFAKRVVGSDSDTKKFRSDFDRTIADLYRDRLFATMSRMLADANLRFVCEPYGGPFHTGEVTPYVHRVMTEFWIGDKFGGGVSEDLFNAGEGRRHNILEAEAFTGGPDRSQWTETPAWLKPVGDGAFCAGINRLVLHTCPLQPWGEDIRPGMTMGQWGTHFGRTQTWWDSGRAWLTYLGRCQALLQWGGRAPGGFSAEGVAVKSIHRTHGDARVFFIAHAGSGGQALCTFAVDGMQPELWDPVRGTMRELSDYRSDDGETIVPLEFAASQSWFVVFRHKVVQPKEPRANFPELRPAAELSGPWEVRFDPKWGGPETATFDQLDDWTKRTEHGIRYYSGTATYRKTFDGNNGSHLDLGVVKCIAQVRLNGRDLGVVWTAPWGVPVPPGLLRERGNVLEVEVANVWANRLIGDEQEPPDCEWRPGHMGHGGYLKRFPDWFVKNQSRPSKGRYGFTTWNYFTKDSPLLPSGLLGPVRLMSEDWTRRTRAPAAKPADGIKRKTSGVSSAALESEVLKTGLASHVFISEERVAHTGGGKDASALFNATTKNGSGGEATHDDGSTFRGYGAASVLTIQLTGPYDLTEIRTFAGHADERASQNYTVLVAHAAAPTKFLKLTSATLRCDGGASELRVKAEANSVVAVRFEFQNGPLGFNVYREINLVGQPTRQRNE
jgi:hypothetical protein